MLQSCHISAGLVCQAVFEHGFLGLACLAVIHECHQLPNCLSRPCFFSFLVSREAKSQAQRLSRLAKYALCTDKSSRLSQHSGLPGVCTQVGVQHTFVLVPELSKTQVLLVRDMESVRTG